MVQYSVGLICLIMVTMVVTACIHIFEVMILSAASCVCVCVYVCVCVCFCVNRVLETLDRTAGAIPVIENAMPFVIVERNVVVEVVVRGRAALQQSGLTTTGLRGRNRVVLPPTLFSLSDVPDTPRFTAVSINNRNLLRPRAQNNRLRGNIISVNLNVPGGLRNLRNDQRIQITINRVCIAHAALQYAHLIIVCLMRYIGVCIQYSTYMM